MYNPYSAPPPYPQNPYPQNQAAYGYPQPGTMPADAYVPLGWRTWLATFGVASVAIASFGVDITGFAFGEEMKTPEPSLVASLLTVVTALGLLGSYVFGAVSFSIWVHRAAKNLVGLGRRGMEFTPGWCVGWFFVPFANLVRPFKAVQEIWRASGPEGRDEGYWKHLPTGPLLPLWWGTWIVGNGLANISSRIDDPIPSATIGAMGSLVTAAAALACIFVMHRIAGRQQSSTGR